MKPGSGAKDERLTDRAERGRTASATIRRRSATFPPPILHPRQIHVRGTGARRQGPSRAKGKVTMRFEHTHTQCPVPLQGDLHEHLVATPEGQYDARIAEFMASASAWAYSDLGAFSDFVCRRGL